MKKLIDKAFIFTHSLPRFYSHTQRDIAMDHFAVISTIITTIMYQHSAGFCHL